MAFRSADCLEEVREIPHGEDHRKRVPERQRKRDRNAAPSGSSLSSLQQEIPMEDWSGDLIEIGGCFGDIFFAQPDPVDAATKDVETAAPEGYSDGFVEEPCWN